LLQLLLMLHLAYQEYNEEQFRYDVFNLAIV